MRYFLVISSAENILLVHDHKMLSGNIMWVQLTVPPKVFRGTLVSTKDMMQKKMWCPLGTSFMFRQKPFCGCYCYDKFQFQKHLWVYVEDSTNGFASKILLAHLGTTHGFTRNILRAHFQGTTNLFREVKYFFTGDFSHAIIII